jgi:hypothetical protein
MRELGIGRVERLQARTPGIQEPVAEECRHGGVGVLHVVAGIAKQELQRVDARRRGLAERLEHGVRRVEARQAFGSAFELVLGFRERQRRVLEGGEFGDGLRDQQA